MSMSVCLSDCLSVCSHISETTRPNFTIFLRMLRVACLGPTLTVLRYVMNFRLKQKPNKQLYKEINETWTSYVALFRSCFQTSMSVQWTTVDVNMNASTWTAPTAASVIPDTGSIPTNTTVSVSVPSSSSSRRIVVVVVYYNLVVVRPDSTIQS